MSDELHSGLVDVVHLPGVVVDATGNVVSGVGHAAVQIPALVSVLIRLIDASRYLALGTLVAAVVIYGGRKKD